jgi:hypothetical protein
MSDKLKGKSNGKASEKPAVDPDISKLVRAIRTSSTADLYHNSYLSRGTIDRLRKQKTKRPQHLTMVGVANAAGLEYRLVPKK